MQIVWLFGSPCIGKTTLVAPLAERSSWGFIQADCLRKEVWSQLRCRSSSRSATRSLSLDQAILESMRDSRLYTALYRTLGATLIPYAYNIAQGSSAPMTVIECPVSLLPAQTLPGLRILANIGVELHQRLLSARLRISKEEAHDLASFLLHVSQRCEYQRPPHRSLPIENLPELLLSLAGQKCEN